MTRFVPVAVLMVVLATGGVALGQPATMFPNGATLVFEDLSVTTDQVNFKEPELGDRPLFFNLAHCTCAKLKKDTFKYRVRETMVSNVGQPVEFWVGTQCGDSANDDRITNCKPVLTLGDVDDLRDGGSLIEFNLFDVVNGKLHETADKCQAIEGAATIWALVNTKTGQSQDFDFSLPQNVGIETGETSSIDGVDTRPPPAPTNVTAAPNEAAIDIFWKAPTSNNTDIAFYQALCAKADGTTARSKSDKTRYVTVSSVCDEPLEKLPTQSLGNGEMEVTQGDDAFGRLSEEFICGEVASSSAQSLTIKGLENGTPYQVILLAVDLHGNYSGTFLSNTVTPHLVTDFWEDLHNRGSDVEGGLCLLAETYGDDSSLTNTLRSFRDGTLAHSKVGRWLTKAYYATLGKLGAVVHGSAAMHVLAAIALIPAIVIALLWHWLSAPGLVVLLLSAWWLRRNRKAVVAWIRQAPRHRVARFTSAAAVVLLVANHAYADGGFRPYWEANDSFDSQEQNPTLDADPTLVKWNVGIRVGPYTPDIDKKFSGKPGPYEQMFPGTRWLPMLDVDRIVWTGFGQIGVGGSIGYMQRTARTFVTGSDPMDPDRPREKGARNAFRMIPAALTATYRFSWLDDQYGIPVVPYLRGGLSYYVWWINAPSGEISKICDENNMCGNKALGASLGVQGSIGLAIRAERIDPSTALSMRASGIQHVGIYGELSAAKVDGFGSDSKLSVGDRTWSAGVNFEF